jgi:hypothetical protein
MSYLKKKTKNHCVFTLIMTQIYFFLQHKKLSANKKAVNPGGEHGSKHL